MSVQVEWEYDRSGPPPFKRRLHNDCGGVVGTDTSGVLLVNGVAMKYRDPDSGLAGDLDLAPWWAEYLVAFDPNYTDNDEFHD